MNNCLLPRLRNRLIAMALVAGLLSFSLGLAPISAVAQKNTTTKSVPINFTSALGTFSGVFTLDKFAIQNGKLVAIGNLTGTVTDALGTVLGTITETLVLGVLNISGTCQILHLELGPIDLDLLGLMVHVDKIVIDITAQSGPGNLLGNLLCGIANLLNTGAPLTQLTRLLNQLLALL